MAEYSMFYTGMRYANEDIKYLKEQLKTFDANNPEYRQKALQNLKDKIGASVDLALKDKSCCEDDSFLSRFLFFNKGDVDKSFEQLIRYLNFKKENTESLRDLTIFDDKIKLAIRDGNPRVLKERDRKGRKIITFTATSWDPEKYSLMDVYRALLISLDKLLENNQNQVLGFNVIVDWTDVSVSQTVHLTPKVLKLIVDGLQNCIPAIFCAVHFICPPWYINLTLSILKSYLTEAMKRRIKVHGSNLSSLHNYVSKDVLPPDLGGEGCSISTLDWYHFLLESSQSFENKQPYRLLQAVKYTKISNKLKT